MTASVRKLRWGVLGYARIARESVIPAILRSDNSEFRALASRDEAKLADGLARFPGIRTHRGYADLLDDPEVDAVYIPLPNSLHREWTVRAAEKGKHVLCEKPLALDAGQVREMIAAAEANRVVLMEAFMYRYTDRTRQVAGVLASGALGEIKFIEASFRFRLANPASIKLQPALGGGALYDVGCYPVNFAGSGRGFGRGRGRVGRARIRGGAVRPPGRDRRDLLGPHPVPVRADRRAPLRIQRGDEGRRGNRRHRGDAGRPGHVL